MRVAAAAQAESIGPDPGRRDLGEKPSRASGSVLETDLLAIALKRALARVVQPLSLAAAGFVQMKGWIPFGFARLEDHARERFGRSGRWLRDLALLGRALERLPALGRALDGSDGGRPLGRVGALAVGRIATETSLAAWIELARRVTVRELKEAVRSARQSGSCWPPGTAGMDLKRRGEQSSDRLETFTPDETEDRRLVRLLVPGTLRAAFDETVVLHRAASGCEATVGSFVEALVAEAHAGLRPPDVDAVPLRRTPDEALAERLLARTTDLWNHLQACSEIDGTMVLTWDVLERLEDIAQRAGGGDARELDRQLRQLIELDDALERRLGGLLCMLSERGAWEQLRFAGVRHYAEERLGLGRTSTESRVRVARSLRRYPCLREAYQQGRVGREAAVLVVRILGCFPWSEAVERSWVARAEEATIKRLRDEARALGRRRYEGTESEAPQPMSDADWHASLSHRPGELRTRVRDLCRRAASVGSSDVFLRLRLPGQLADGFLATIEATRRRLETDVRQIAWDKSWPDPDAPPSTLAARSLFVRCRRIPSWVGLMALVEDYVDTWDPPRVAGRRKSERIYARDGWRCSAAGCSSRRNLENHHPRYRSRGGSRTDPANQTCACRFHHQWGEHGVLATVRGRAPLGLVWRLGRDGIGGRFRNERSLPVRGVA
jgi:hypothetical protein